MSFGYLVEQGPAGVVREADSSTCGHCNRVSFLKPQPSGVIVRPARCGVCHAAVCEECYGRGCTPLEKRLEREEAAARLHQSLGV